MAAKNSLSEVFELNRRIATALGYDLAAPCCNKRGGGHTVDDHYGAPEYGLDPVAMVGLIDEMRKRYWFAVIESGEDAFTAEFHGEGANGEEIVWHGEADTLPLAVARTAEKVLVPYTEPVEGGAR